MANRDRILGSPRCPENLPPTRPPFRTRPPGGSLGGFPPLILGGQKRVKNGQFLPPCGAKSWGSGGAPPTNLILLRNQRQPAERPARPRTGPARPGPGPPGAPPAPRPAPWLVVVGFGWGGVRSVRDWVLRRVCDAVRVSPSEGKDSTPSAHAPTASSLSVVCPRIRAVWDPLSLPDLAHSAPLAGRYRSSIARFPRLRRLRDSLLESSD